jgi:nucleoside-diphosphate-sugar epimerase
LSTNEIKENNKINLYNEGQFYRDYIDVEDVADGIKFIIDNGENSEVYNLASGVPVLFKDIIDYAYNQLNSTSEIGIMEPTDFHKLVQVESMYLDTAKLNNLGFKPSKNIYQIIDNLIK